MAAFTLTELRDRLARYVAAETAILSGQSYRIGDRQLTRAELAEVRAEIRELAGQIARAESAASGTRGRLRYGMPG